MALTLTEGEKYSTTELDRTVIDLLVKDSVILQKLPFVEILGNSLTYDQISTVASVEVYSLYDTWSERTSTVTQNSVKLKILGGDADVDNFLQNTHANKINIKATILANKIKATQYKFLDTFYYGDDSSNTKEFDGLQVLISSTTYNTVHAGTGTGTALSINKLRQAIDMIKGTKPNVMAMSKLMRRSLTTYYDSIGDKLRDAVSPEFGGFVQFFEGIPIIVDDHIVDTETASSGAYSAKTGGGNTTIFILSFSDHGCCGIQGPNSVETIEVGDLETKDATRTRIRWYCGLKFENLLYCAKVDGIDADGTVTA